MEEYQIISRKKKNNIPVIIAIVASVLIVLVLIIVLVANSKPSRINSHMKAAEKFLDEMDYKNAIAEYNAILEIDHENIEAYLGLSDIYMAIGDIDTAINTLNQAYELTHNDMINNKLNEYIEYKENLYAESSDTEEILDDNDKAEDSSSSDLVLSKEFPDIDYDELIDTLLSCGDFGEYRWDGKSDFTYLKDVYGLVDNYAYLYRTENSENISSQYIGMRTMTFYNYDKGTYDNGIDYEYFGYSDCHLYEISEASPSSLPSSGVCSMRWMMSDNGNNRNIYSGYIPDFCSDNDNIGIIKFIDTYKVKSTKEFLELNNIDVNADYLFFENIPTEKYGMISLIIQHNMDDEYSFTMLFDSNSIYDSICLQDSYISDFGKDFPNKISSSIYFK